MKIDITTRYYNLVKEPERLLRMTLFMIIWAFMGIVSKIPMSDRILLNPTYELFLSIGFVFAVLCISGILIQYQITKNTKEILKKYKIQVIT